MTIEVKITSRTPSGALAKLSRRIKRDAERLADGFKAAARTTARRAVPVVRSNVPVAFGELRDSVQDFTRGTDGDPVTAVDAPHAAAVEIGSLPHVPNMKELTAWVRLRGMQGLTKRGALKRGNFAPGNTTAYQAQRIATLLKQLEVRGRRGAKDKKISMAALGKAAKNGSIAKLLASKKGRPGHGRYSPVDAAEQVAFAIAEGIMKHGTKPHWYAKKSLPAIAKILGDEVTRRLKSDRGYSRVKDSELY